MLLPRSSPCGTSSSMAPPHQEQIPVVLGRPQTFPTVKEPALFSQCRKKSSMGSRTALYNLGPGEHRSESFPDTGKMSSVGAQSRGNLHNPAPQPDAALPKRRGKTGRDTLAGRWVLFRVSPLPAQGQARGATRATLSAPCTGLST